MSLRSAIEAVVEGREVPGEILEESFREIMEGEASPAAISALLVGLRIKGETVAEIVAAARACRRRAVMAETIDRRAVDLCGTGGDGAETFNISTTAAFVVAGAGVPVAKHGNRAVSSRAGSIDVFEALGVEVELPVETSAQILSEVGIAPFFARIAHPAMRHVAPVRQELGIRTLMNCLGPLLNPMGVHYQVVGVYDADLVERIAGALAELGTERALVVHGSDGLDELTTTGPSSAAFVERGQVQTLRVNPSDFGIPEAIAGSLRGGDAEQGAEILRAVLAGEAGARRDIVCLNAAAALWVAGAVDDLEEGVGVARRSIDSGAAERCLRALVEATRTVGSGR
ncbi:anthranilate phosphoribosyltransferase [Myxococcota bacterium]|nr:anthranilate phosphoribosyltransferase [Myxococcota bacterium]